LKKKVLWQIFFWKNEFRNRPLESPLNPSSMSSLPRLYTRSNRSSHKICQISYGPLPHLGSPQPLFDAIASESMYKIRSFNPQELSNTVWAFATIGFSSQPLFDAIASKSLYNIRSFKPQNLSNIVWAFATLGVSSQPLFDAIASESMHKIRSFNPQDLCQLHQAELHQNSCHQKSFLKEPLKSKCSDAFKSDVVHVSNFQIEVENILSGLGVEFDRELLMHVQDIRLILQSVILQSK
jgi:hypothetical protein